MKRKIARAATSLEIAPVSQVYRAFGVQPGAARGRVRRLAGAAAVCLAAQTALAATPYTWDPNGAAAGTGGTGFWNTTDLSWTTNNTTFVPWPSTGTDNLAVFGGTGGTVTLNAPVFANGLTFGAPNYTIGTTGTGKLTLNGVAPTFTTNGVDARINGSFALTGGTAINKFGPGTLTLTGDNSGGVGANTTVTVGGSAGVAGTLDTATGLYNSAIAINDGKQLGNSAGNVLTLNGGTLAFNQTGGAGYFSSRTINVTAGGGAIFDGGFAPGLSAGGNTISPTVNIAAGAGLNLVANNQLLFDAGNGGAGAGPITGAGGVNIYGSNLGTVRILSNANTYQGGTTLTPGSRLVIGGANSLGGATRNLTNAGTLDLNGVNLAVGQLASNSGTFNFRLTGGSTNQLTASSAAVSGTTRIAFGPATGTAFTPGASYTVLTSAAGGLGGNYVGSFAIAGSQDLSVPVNAVLVSNGTGGYTRLTATAAANLAGTAVSVTTNAATATGRVISVLPLGSSITAGTSAQVPYDGAGYRSQLYQNLANDARFIPTFTGTQNSTEANGTFNNGPPLTVTVGQNLHEGHPGFPTGAILNNLSNNYLRPGNGVNPDYITLNIGGNDYVQNYLDTQAINRLDGILDGINTLRPDATTVVSSILVRTDANRKFADGINGVGGFNNLYNPLIPGLVYQHVLAGEHVSFLDLANLINESDLSPDNVHPTQAGYNKMADAWYAAITTGQSFYTAAAGGTWTNTAGGTTNWAQNFQRTTAGAVPAAGTDVYFNGVGGTVTLGTNVAARSINFTRDATAPVTLTGANTLTLGTGGITVQAGTGTHTIASNVNLATAQTWGNVSTSTFTVGGNVGGSGPLTIVGSGTFSLSGANTYAGGTALTGGTLVAANTSGSATGTGLLAVADGATLAGTGTTGPVSLAGTLAPGATPGAIGSLTTGAQTWSNTGRFSVDVTANGGSNDQVTLSALTIGATPADPFEIIIAGSGILPAGTTLTLATDTDLSAGNPFAPGVFQTQTLPKLSLAVMGLSPAAGFAFALDSRPVLDAQSNQAGFALVLSQTAVPEPATAGLLMLGAPLLLARRRR